MFLEEVVLPVLRKALQMVVFVIITVDSVVLIVVVKEVLKVVLAVAQHIPIVPTMSKIAYILGPLSLWRLVLTFLDIPVLRGTSMGRRVRTLPFYATL